VDLALVARSAPVSLLELLPVLGCAGGDLLGSASVGRPPQPRCRRRVVLGHEHVAAASSVQLLEGGLVATTVAAPPCRRHGLPSCSSMSTPVSLLLLLQASVLALGGLASKPGMFAYATLCCCCSAHSCAVMLLLLCSSLCCDAVAALLELVL
jgi:hypothetical protein